jgi:hypothetical protein
MHGVRRRSRISEGDSGEPRKLRPKGQQAVDPTQSPTRYVPTPPWSTQPQPAPSQPTRLTPFQDRIPLSSPTCYPLFPDKFI